MKIAYLILAHNDMEHLQRLANKLKKENTGVYIHIDKKSEFSDCGINNAKVISKYNIYWGGYSIIQATIELIKNAINEGYDYYILISGDSYPIITGYELEQYLKCEKGMNFIDIRPMPSETKSINRLTKYYLEGGNRVNSFNGLVKKFINKILEVSPIDRDYKKYLLNYNLYSGSQWFALNHEFISYFIKFIDDNPTFLKFFEHSKISDEMFFQIIIMNSDFKEKINDSLMYTNWNIGEGPFPSKLEEIHIKDFNNTKQKKFFARKINSSNIHLFEKIK